MMNDGELFKKIVEWLDKRPEGLGMPVNKAKIVVQDAEDCFGKDIREILKQTTS